jgi:hypothetical protein
MHDLRMRVRASSGGLFLVHKLRDTRGYAIPSLAVQERWSSTGSTD